MNKHLTWAQIDLSAIRHNFRVLQRLAGIPTATPGVAAGSGKVKILAVIKADAYGHGMLVAKVLVKEKVDFIGLSNLTEGIALREAGIKTPVLLFETTLAEQAQNIIDYELTPTICTHELAAALNRYAQKRKRVVDIHVKVDTGMGRLGVWHEEALDFIKKLSRLRNLRVQGICTHFPSADTDQAFTRRQIRDLENLVSRLKAGGLHALYVHAANSMGLVGYPNKILNLARPGLMLYGLYPRPGLEEKVNLRPAMSIHSKIIFLKRIEKGRSISYGRTFIASRPMTVATLPIGYSDGYLRGLSGKADVLVGGQRCPVLGRVTMDQIVVDVSKIKNPRLGMPVVILGKQGKEEVCAYELAQLVRTINYEIVCSLGSRLPRLYKKA
ncbi:MAG: alanine racemase [Candidatus Omnitrophica bacterium]|nr:alanine racemase [Candidatus Omnitrophota bacterium]